MQSGHKKLGKYTILAMLGQGSFGWVYKVTDPLGRTVAIKVLKLDRHNVRDVDRFRREARVAGELFHQHIATILDFDEVEGRFFLVMHYVDGLSLDALIAQKGTLGWDEALVILQQVASALDYAHAHGYVHRDVKPQNILVSSNEGAVLTDFGLVRAADVGGGTSSGTFLGTPYYAAPEVWNGHKTSAGTDVYSLACVAYEMLTGNLLFPGVNMNEVVIGHLINGAVLPYTWPEGVPAGVKDVFLRALEKDISMRTVSAGGFVKQLSLLESWHIAMEEARLRREAAANARLQEEEHRQREAEKLARLQREALERELVEAEKRGKREAEELERLQAERKAQVAEKERHRRERWRIISNLGQLFLERLSSTWV